MKKEEDVEIPEENKTKKVFTLIIAIILLILFSSYFLLGPQGMSVFGGFSESSIINENNLAIEKGGIVVEFTGEVYQELKKIFIENEGQEFKACLEGEKEKNKYKINQIIIPETYEQEFTRVRAAPCEEKTLIDLHSHPLNSCTPSFHDVQVLKKIKANDKDRIMAVMCNVERFTFYP